MDTLTLSAKPDLFSVIEGLGIDDSDKELFLQQFLGVSQRTVKRRLEGDPPSKGEQLQLEMLANVSDLAKRMFGSQAAARIFLNTPLPAFDNRTALELLNSVDGYERVKSVIIGQAYGMF